MSGAQPTDIAGQPAYTVRVEPKRNGGLLGGAELAWDAVHGTPLRAAVYAKGDSSPVLELKVTDISYGAVSSSVFDITPPPDAQVTDVSPPAHQDNGQRDAAPVTGLQAVQQQTSFPIAAPDTLAGLAAERGAAHPERQGRRSAGHLRAGPRWDRRDRAAGRSGAGLIRVERRSRPAQPPDRCP